MKTCSRCNQTKDPDAFYACKRMKDGKNSHCKMCDKKLIKAYYESNREKLLEQKKEYYTKNKDQIAEYCNKNKKNKKAYDAKYRKENSDKRVAYVAKRRAQKMKTAQYGNAELTDFVMQEAAYTAKKRTESTGVLHHVDHIVPLNGDTVCGFHTWNNLRVIPANENIAKGNKLIEDLL